MIIRQFGEVTAMEYVRGGKETVRRVAFHSRSLDIAEIDDATWQAFEYNKENKNTDLSDPTDFQIQEALTELIQWNEEENTTSSLPEELLSQTTGVIQGLTLNVTQLCNLRCTYCAAGGDGTYGDPVTKISIEKTLPQLAYFLKKVPSGHLFHLNFLGGEPLLYPELVEAIAAFTKEQAQEREIYLKFVITTNGTLITEKSLSVLSKYQMHANVSCDGPPEINDMVRVGKDGKGSSPALLVGLKKLAESRAQGHLGGLGISSVFGPEHIEILKTYTYFEELVVDNFSIGPAVDWYDFNYTLTPHPDFQKNRFFSEKYADEMAKVAQKAVHLHGEPGLLKIKVFRQFFDILDRKIPLTNHCGAGKTHLSIDARNQVYACPWWVGKKEDVVGAQSTETHLYTQALTQFSEDLIAKNPCQKCWARHMCGGGCMFVHQNKTGSRNQVDLDFCFRTKSLLKSTFMYYELIRGYP